MTTEAAVQTSMTLGCFEVRGRVYAVDVAHLREVVRWQPVTPLPRAPELIEGVIELRDAIVPVVDLGRALLGEPVEPTPRARVVVAEVDGLVLGLAVDAAIEILAGEPRALEDPPALATPAGYEATRAVARRPGAGPILLLSLEDLLARIYRSAADTGRAG